MPFFKAFINDTDERGDKGRERGSNYEVRDPEAEAEHARELAAGIVERYGKGKQREERSDEEEDESREAYQPLWGPLNDEEWDEIEALPPHMMLFMAHYGAHVWDVQTFRMKVKVCRPIHLLKQMTNYILQEGKASICATKLSEAAVRRNISSSIFSLDLVPNFIFIQVHLPSYDLQKLLRLCTDFADFGDFYPRLTTRVPPDEVPELLRTARNLTVYRGIWATIQRGIYAGDTALMFDDDTKGVPGKLVASVPRPAPPAPPGESPGAPRPGGYCDRIIYSNCCGVGIPKGQQVSISTVSQPAVNITVGINIPLHLSLNGAAPWLSRLRAGIQGTFPAAPYPLVVIGYSADGGAGRCWCIIRLWRDCLLLLV